MSEWKPIDSAPKDGSEVYVRRVFEGRVVKEGLAVFDVPVPTAPMLESIGPDPLGRPVDYASEARWIEEAKVNKRWLNPDRGYAFPTPTEWRP